MLIGDLHLGDSLLAIDPLEHQGRIMTMEGLETFYDAAKRLTKEEFGFIDFNAKGFANVLRDWLTPSERKPYYVCNAAALGMAIVSKAIKLQVGTDIVDRLNDINLRESRCILDEINFGSQERFVYALRDASRYRIPDFQTNLNEILEKATIICPQNSASLNDGAIGMYFIFDKNWSFLKP